MIDSMQVIVVHAPDVGGSVDTHIVLGKLSAKAWVDRVMHFWHTTGAWTVHTWVSIGTLVNTDESSSCHFFLTLVLSRQLFKSGLGM